MVRDPVEEALGIRRRHSTAHAAIRRDLLCWPARPLMFGAWPDSVNVRVGSCRSRVPRPGLKRFNQVRPGGAVRSTLVARLVLRAQIPRRGRGRRQRARREQDRRAGHGADQWRARCSGTPGRPGIGRWPDPHRTGDRRPVHARRIRRRHRDAAQLSNAVSLRSGLRARRLPGWCVSDIEGVKVR